MNDLHCESPAVAHLACSTENVAPDQWCDVVCGMIPGLSFDWLGDQPQPARLGTGTFAKAAIIELASQRAVKVMCAPDPNASGDTYDLVLQHGGSGRCRHAGRDEAWTAGDLLLFDSAQSFEVVHPSEYHISIWKLPRESLAPLLAAPDRSVGRRIPGSVGSGAILGNFLRALTYQAAQLDATAQHCLLMHLCGLVGLALGASREGRESQRETLRAVRRQEILTYIETHWRDPGLTVQRAARDLRMSPRWLHALLEEGDISFAAWVAERRLEECKKLLNDPAGRALTVAEAALRSGFGSMSTFNRRFRSKFGMTPRDARRVWAEQAGKTLPG